jgi:CRP-like cAMP-binding protein
MRKDSSYYNQSIKVLQNSTLFSGLEESMIEEILGYFTPVTLPKKTIIHYSQTIESVFIILKGRVKLSKINPSNGREYIVSLLEQGDVFDVITLLDKREHEINIESIDELQLLKTSTTIARDWLNNNPMFNKNFLPYVGNRMRLLEEAGSNLVLYDTITRLAKLILSNVNKHNIKNQEDFSVKLINNLSHESLAQMIGSVRKVVNMNIQELKKEGIVNSMRGKLSVTNLQKLIEKAKLDMD